MQFLKKEYIFLCVAVAAAAALRFWYCYDMPVSGDECVSLVQASGKALISTDYISKEPVHISEVNRLIEYSDDYTAKDVLASLRYNGMHPPFYYLLLHFVLKFFGNGIVALRLGSVLVSAGSVAFVYVISKRVSTEIIAWPAALLLAFCPYGIHYAHMIRPYPLSMFLALLSTWLMLRMYDNIAINVSRGQFWWYVLASVIGLYTIYHFVFVFAFQMIFLFLAAGFDKCKLLHVLAVPVITGFLYLPWLGSFRDQLKVAQNESFYFYGSSSLVKVYKYFVEFNFLGALPGDYSWYKFAIAIAVTIAICVGFVYAVKRPAGRYLAAAAAAYFVFNLLADWKMRTQTLNVTKLLFFAVPLILLFASWGFSVFIKYRRAAGIILLGVVLAVLAYNSGALMRNPAAEDDPRQIDLYRSFVAVTSKPGKLSLIIVNEPHRRTILPLSHAMPFRNLYFLAARDEGIISGTDMSQFSNVYVIWPQFDKFIENETAKRIDDIMAQNDLAADNMNQIPKPLQGHMLVYQKN